MTTLSVAGQNALNEFIVSLFPRLFAWILAWCIYDKDSYKSKDIPGFVVGVSNVEGEIYSRGCGTHVIRDPASAEINLDSVLWICSQTKMVTAVRMNDDS